MDQSFEMFKDRHNQLFTHNYQPFAIKIDDKKLHALYEVAATYHGHLFFSKLEKTMYALDSLYRVIFSILENLPNRNKELEEAFYIFIEDEHNFNKMLAYIPSYLKSLSVKRIEALYPKHSMYQEIQHFLFDKLPFYGDFEQSYRMHERLIDQLYLKFHLILFEGDIFITDSDFEEKLFLPTFEEAKRRMEKKTGELLENTGYDVEELRTVLQC